MIAPNAKAAAQYYPANYWYALAQPPMANEFPGTGPQGNGIAPVMATQQRWLSQMKSACLVCHQLGDQATRELSDNSEQGWAHRIERARPAGDQTIGDQGKGYAISMQNIMSGYGRDRALKMFADWTQRVAKGELPPEAPPRPQGIERNLVLTEWDWGNNRFLHDEVSTDRRNPRFNANGPIYGLASNTGHIASLNPNTHTVSEIEIPGASRSYPHTLMMDQKGRIWTTDTGQGFLAQVDAGPRPDYCTNESSNKFAKYYPEPGKAGLIHMYDPAAKKVVNIPDCFRTHHLNFARDKSNTLYFSGDANVVGWIDTKIWDEAQDPTKAVGWCPMVLDTKEKGVTKVALGAESDVTITPDRTLWNEPGKPADPNKDTRIMTGLYGIENNPVDNSMWYGVSAYPGAIVRFDRGARPPETCKTEYYEPPKLADGTYAVWSPRGISFDSKGVAWISLASGQMASFDRSKCKVLRGPSVANGQHCVEGWKIFENPAVPTFKGINRSEANADWYYQSWVDMENIMGLGKNIPMTAGSNSDSILALMPDTGKFVNFRVPYPLGFNTRWLEGRLDDPAAGWKGRGVWATYSDVPVWHQEAGEEGRGPELVKFQLRPDPLAH